MGDQQFSVERCGTGWVLVDGKRNVRSAQAIQDVDWLLDVAERANRQGAQVADKAIGGDWTTRGWS